MRNGHRGFYFLEWTNEILGRHSLTSELYQFLCIRSVEKEYVFLYSIAAQTLKHEGMSSDVLI